jgi:hypothetical protein
VAVWAVALDKPQIDAFRQAPAKKPKQTNNTAMTKQKPQNILIYF